MNEKLYHTCGFYASVISQIRSNIIHRCKELHVNFEVPRDWNFERLCMFNQQLIKTQIELDAKSADPIVLSEGYISNILGDIFKMEKENVKADYQNTAAPSMTFGEALIGLKEGRKVARQGWNGKGMFLTMNGGYSVSSDNCKPQGNVNAVFLDEQGCASLKILPHIDMWTATKELCVGWLASQTDMLSNDWVFIE